MHSFVITLYMDAMKLKDCLEAIGSYHYHTLGVFSTQVCDDLSVYGLDATTNWQAKPVKGSIISK